MSSMGDLYLLAMLKQSAPRKKSRGDGGSAGAAAAGGAVGGAIAGAGTSMLMSRLMRKAVDARTTSLKGELESKIKAFQALGPLQKIRFLLKGKR